MIKRDGFTLLEVLVVVMILSILATIVGVAVLNKPAKAKIATAKVQISAGFESALKQYHLENGMFPTEEQGLEALVSVPEAEPVPKRYPDGGYMAKTKLPLDPWGNQYVYFAPGRDGAPYEIVSYGSDGKPGGDGEAADISSVDL